MATYLWSLIMDFPIWGNPASEGTLAPSLLTLYADLAAALLPVAIICAMSLLGTAVWLVAVGTHLRPGDTDHA